MKRMPEDLPAKLAASLCSRTLYPILLWRSGALLCQYSDSRDSVPGAEPCPSEVDDIVLVRIDADAVHVRQRTPGRCCVFALRDVSA